MIFINNDELIIKVLRLRRVDPIGGYNFFLHYSMGNSFYTLPVQDTGDEYTMVFVIPSSFTSTLPSGEYTYSVMADSQVVTSGMARKRETDFPADSVYVGTGDERTRYNVSIFASQGGYLMVNGQRYQNYVQSVPEGQILAVQAVSEAGYTFDGWSDEVEDNPRAITVTEDITLFATYEAAEYTVSISAGSNGSVSVNGVVGDYTATLAYGTVLTIEAEADTDYEFEQWSDGNTENPRTITVTGPVALAAAFQEAVQYFDVSISAGQNGTVSVNGVVGNYSQSVTEGTVLTLVATPDEGYSFTSWSDSNNDNPRTLTVTGDITLTSSYEEATQYFNVSITAGQNGTVSVNGVVGNYSQSVAEGTVLTLEAVPNTGYDFTSWSDGNTDNPRTITVTSNVYLTSAYATQLFTVTVTPDPNCPVYVNGHEYTTTYTRSDVRYGENYVIEARPATGYSWVGWNDGSTTNPRILQITSNVSLTPSVSVSEYWVWVTPGANGITQVNGTTISGTYHQKHTYGSTVTLQAYPSYGYQFDGWGDGNSDNPRTITVTGAVNLTSSYSMLTYSVSISAGANGSVSVNNVVGDYSQTVNHGTQLALRAIADQDYEFVQWSDGSTSTARNVTVTSDLTLTASFQAQAVPSPLNTVYYTTSNGSTRSSWAVGYDDEGNSLSKVDTSHYGRIVFDGPVHQLVIGADDYLESVTTSYRTEDVGYGGGSLPNFVSLTMKSPHLTSLTADWFTNLQYLESWHANDDATISGLSNLPASGTCTTRTDNNLWGHSDLSGWTFQALGTVITYEAEEQMDLEGHNVYNRHTEGVQPASHTFSDGVGTITYDETVGELRDNWGGCDKLYLPDTVGYFEYCEYLPQAMEVGEYFGIVGGSMYAGEDWGYTHLFNNGLQPDCAVTVCQDNPILTIGTDGCLYNKEDWMGLQVVNQTVSSETVALLEMDDRCVDASTCMLSNMRDVAHITRLVLGNSCQSLKLYQRYGWDYGAMDISELVINDALQTINPNLEHIFHASGGSNNPYLNVTNSGYTIESEDGTTLYWCGDASADLSDYTHFAEACCGNLSFSSMPDISSATQVDRLAFYGVNGLSTWVWPNNSVTFNGKECLRDNNSVITRMEFGNHSVTFNNDEDGAQFLCWTLDTIVFKSTTPPTQSEQGNNVFQGLPPVGTVYIPLGSDYSTFLYYPGNASNIGQWTVKYIMDDNQLAIRHTPGVTITAPTITGLNMRASEDIGGWLKVTYDNDITAYDSTSLQYNADVLEVVLPDSCLSVGNGAFLGCSGLTKVTAYGLTSVGNSAFYGTAISEFSAKGVTSFGSGAFGGCTSLTSVEFGENLATLGNGLFYNCSSLEYVGFDGINGPTITNNDLGSGIHATGTIYIPKYSNDASFADFIAAMPVGWALLRRKQNQILYQTSDSQAITDVPQVQDGGSTLASHTYANGWGVIEYTGDKLDYVGGFGNKGTLTYVSLPKIYAATSNGFQYCTALTTVEIQDCTNIDWSAFEGCPIANGPDTGRLTVPPSTQCVWGGAFSSLESGEIEFGPALHSIDAGTFNLQNATDIYVYTTHTMEDYGDPFTNTPASGTLHMADAADAAYWTQYLPGWTVAYDLGRKLYYTTTNSSVLAPYNASAFSPATIVSNTYSGGQGVIEFDRDIVTIGGSAYKDCTTLETITLPRTLTAFEANAQFQGCTSLTSVTLPYGLTNIRNFAFDGCTSLASIEIPETVASIGLDAFHNCTGLTSVTIPGSVEHIEEQAFYGCTNLSSLTLYDGLKRIDTIAFGNCTSLVSVHIPKSFAWLTTAPFRGCTSLSSIKVEQGSASYDSRDNCNAMITIYDNILVQGCKGTVIPNSVTSIQNQAFMSHSGLTAITIPASVASIGNEAFRYCTGLASIAFENTTGVPTIGNYVFDGVASTGTVYGEPNVDYSTVMSQLPNGWTLVQ